MAKNALYQYYMNYIYFTSITLKLQVLLTFYMCITLLVALVKSVLQDYYALHTFYLCIT